MTIWSSAAKEAIKPLLVTVSSHTLVEMSPASTRPSLHSLRPTPAHSHGTGPVLLEDAKQPAQHCLASSQRFEHACTASESTARARAHMLCMRFLQPFEFLLVARAEMQRTSRHVKGDKEELNPEHDAPYRHAVCSICRHKKNSKHCHFAVPS